MSSQYGHPLYGEGNYGPGEGNIGFFLKYFLDCFPPAYIRPEHRDFWERFFYYAALDIANFNAVFDVLDEYVSPGTAPEDWLDWMLKAWWDWTLIPEGYPVHRKRRLLANLHLHYKRRYTIIGIRELLKEFGIVAEVYDRRTYVRGYARAYGSRAPLYVRVRVLGYEPFFTPRRTYVRGYVGRGGTHVHTTRQIITEKFVRALINWSRAAGVHFTVEWRMGSQSALPTSTIPDDDAIIVP